MMETDDKLIEEFMAAGKGEIDDNGFTSKVMARLPQRSGNSVALIVAAMVAVVALVCLFFVSGAAQGLLLLVRDVIVGALKSGTLLADIRTCAIIVVGLLVVAAQKISSIS
jgi:hypothetical protein